MTQQNLLASRVRPSRERLLVPVKARQTHRKRQTWDRRVPGLPTRATNEAGLKKPVAIDKEIANNDSSYNGQIYHMQGNTHPGYDHILSQFLHFLHQQGSHHEYQADGKED